MAMGLTFSLPHAFAEDTRPPIRELKPGSGQKKRIPSLERIYYYYDAGQLELEPNFEYSAIYVTVSPHPKPQALTTSPPLLTREKLSPAISTSDSISQQPPAFHALSPIHISTNSLTKFSAYERKEKILRRIHHRDGIPASPRRLRTANEHKHWI